MDTPLREQLLDQILHIVELARPAVATISKRDRDLASQIRSALSSVALNAGEGCGAAGGNARLRFESARGSLYEGLAGLRVAIAWGYVSSNTCAPALEAMDRLGGRLFGLCRRE
jgi:four helix bundle protein